MMIHLIYVSSASREMSEAELIFLLGQCRERNRQHNVTGMLLYIDGNFFQVLEGEQANVDKIYADIIKDTRHKGLIRVERSDINERTFPDWSMGFKAVRKEDVSRIDGFTDFTEKDLQPEDIATKSSYVLEMLYQFRDASNSGNAGKTS